MNMKAILRSTLYILWGVVLAWGVIFADNTIRPILAAQMLNASPYLYDLASVAAMLFAALMPVVWAPKFFGYQLGNVSRHGKLLLGMTVFFVGTPLFYRLILGETPFGANTWFFEGVVVPIAEEGFFRGILLSMLLWGFAQQYKESIASRLALLFSTLIFAAMHLNNLGHYPTGFVLFQVGFATVLGLSMGYARIKTESLYPAILLHAVFNLAGTL